MGMVKGDFPIGKEDSGGLVRVDAVIAAPFFNIVGKNFAGGVAGDGIPGNPVAGIEAEEQVGGVLGIGAGTGFGDVQEFAEGFFAGGRIFQSGKFAFQFPD